MRFLLLMVTLTCKRGDTILVDTDVVGLCLLMIKRLPAGKDDVDLLM
jgi:hypothetical protein